MDSEVAALKAHIDAIVPTLATKADIEVLRAEMHKMSAEGYRWMVASMVGMFIGFGGLYFAANRSLEERPAPVQAQPQPQQPIIIYLPQPVPAPQK
ncbi:hypothetical protein HUX88_11600 [Duganella sp. BJB1802]|uniref:hypothetical protein n=1 Tax=Duganella sp. BJB1802 TaxID=2744575 RepID=UPI001593B0E8|nr:hypothetical protein [Duganella sp. BJB1802]NVD71197.1 hypothetical protein [Duganella sp. BJB1802]